MAQQHLEPYIERTDSGLMTSWVEVHTYNPDSTLALVVVYGNNSDDNSASVDLWLTYDEVKAIRDALNKILGDDHAE